jgi:DNA-binding NarL/FixJ family response regulator
MSDSSVRVLIVDDQPPFREAAKVVFDLLDQFDVVGEATSGEEAVGLVATLHPDLVVMDINLPGMSGVDATREITTTHPDIVVLLVSTYEANALPLGAASCGALAYVHKEHLDPDLIEQLWEERSNALWRTA